MYQWGLEISLKLHILNKRYISLMIKHCAVLPFTVRLLLTGLWLLNLVWSHWQHSLQGTRQKWTDLSHHAQLSMCTSRDKMAASRMEFSALIQSEFVAVVSWKLGWLCFLDTKFALLRSDDVIKWKHFPPNWPFEWEIHRSLVNSPYKGQLHGALMFSLICTWINGWVNNGEAGDLRRHCAHYDVIVLWWVSFLILGLFSPIWDNWMSG